MKKEHVIESLDFLANVEHFVASFWNFENDEIYWASKCRCGSDVDEQHQCLALKAKRA